MNCLPCAVAVCELCVCVLFASRRKRKRVPAPGPHDPRQVRGAPARRCPCCCRCQGPQFRGCQNGHFGAGNAGQDHGAWAIAWGLSLSLHPEPHASPCVCCVVALGTCVCVGGVFFLLPRSCPRSCCTLSLTWTATAQKMRVTQSTGCTPLLPRTLPACPLRTPMPRSCALPRKIFRCCSDPTHCVLGPTVISFCLASRAWCHCLAHFFASSSPPPLCQLLRTVACVCIPRGDLNAQVPTPSIPKQNAKRWQLSLLVAVCPRRYLLRRCALELFFSDGRSTFFSFDSSRTANRVMTLIFDQKPPKLLEIR